MQAVPILITFLYCLTVKAQFDCSSIRLDAPGGPVHSLPIMDQADLPFCESFASVIAIDAARFYDNGNSAVEPVSCPISLAVRTAGLAGLQSIESLGVETLLKNVHLVGICDQQQIAKQLAASLEKNFCSDISAFASTLRTSGEFAKTPGSNSCGLRQQNINALDPLKVLAHVTKTEANAKALQLKFDQLCVPLTKPTNLNKYSPNHHNSKPFTTEQNSPTRKQRYNSLRASIDEALSGSKPVPPVIRYCSNFLFDANSPSGIDPSKGNMENCNKRDSRGNTIIGKHTSAVVGRRKSKDGKSCEFLIRNSAGTSCNPYDKKWECDTTKGGLPCPAGDICGGQVWVDEETLLSNLQDVIHLKAK